MKHRFRHERAALLDAPIERAFAYLDDFKALSAHMESRSLAMAGSSMAIVTDSAGGRAVGSHVHMAGRMFGMTLSLDEVVVERQPPFRKSWETVDAKLLVIGQYRLGFALSPQQDHSLVRAFIDYDPPVNGPGRWLGRLLGGFYARWCLGRMVGDAVRHFSVAREPRQVQRS